MLRHIGTTRTNAIGCGDGGSAGSHHMSRHDIRSKALADRHELKN